MDSLNKNHTILLFAIDLYAGNPDASSGIIPNRRQGRAHGASSGPEPGCKLPKIRSVSLIDPAVFPIDDVAHTLNGFIQPDVAGIDDHIIVGGIFNIFMEIFADEGTAVGFGF